MMKFLNRWEPAILSVFRIMVALLFVQHGLMKIFGFPAPQPGTGAGLSTTLLVAALIELIGGGLTANPLIADKRVPCDTSSSPVTNFSIYWD